MLDVSLAAQQIQQERKRSLLPLFITAYTAMEFVE